MSHPRILAALLAGALITVAALGLAQSGGTPSPGTNPNAPGTAPSPSPDAASVEVEAKLKAEAEDQAKANAKARLDAILERGAKEPVKARTDAEAKIQKHIQAVDDGAVKEGDAKLAERLGAEFGMGAEAVLTEKQNLGASWGELMLAHLLQAHSNATLTVEQIHQ